MTTRFFVAIAFLLGYNISFSCDLCTIYLGIQPNDFTNSISLRHRYRLFERDYINNESHSNFYPTQRKAIIDNKHGGNPTSGIAKGDTYRYSEAFNSYDLSLNVFLSKKIQFNGSIGFSDNYAIENDSIIDNIGGIGDLNLITKYQLFNSKKLDDTLISKKIIQRLSLGGGIILPTGNYNKYSIENFETSFTSSTTIYEPKTSIDPHLQAGVGSLSYLLFIEYLIKLNSFGINTNISYKLNTTNKNEFRFANRLNANATVFMQKKIAKNLKFMANLGISYEYSKRDVYEDLPFIDSGGEVLFLNSGINLFINKFGIEFTYFEPIKESLMGIQPFNKRRIVSQLSYYF